MVYILILQSYTALISRALMYLEHLLTMLMSLMQISGKVQMHRT